jgi:FkbH-like protein
MTDEELLRWSLERDRRCWTIRVADRFSDLGLTGLVSVQVEGDDLRIVDFVLSCRVFGRKVEETMLSIVVQHARDHRLRRALAEYLPTPKNKPCLDFLQRSGMTEAEGGAFWWDAGDELPFPAQVRVDVEPSELMAS